MTSVNPISIAGTDNSRMEKARENKFLDRIYAALRDWDDVRHVRPNDLPGYKICKRFRRIK